jgi:hypothetical protein
VDAALPAVTVHFPSDHVAGLASDPRLVPFYSRSWLGT